MLDKKTTAHIVYFICLFLVFAASLLLVSKTSHNPSFQMMIIILMTFFYVAWALLHHYIEHDLHAKIVIEYVLIGALGISLVYFTISLIK